MRVSGVLVCAASLVGCASGPPPAEIRGALTGWTEQASLELELEDGRDVFMRSEGPPMGIHISVARPAPDATPDLRAWSIRWCLGKEGACACAACAPSVARVASDTRYDLLVLAEPTEAGRMWLQAPGGPIEGLAPNASIVLARDGTHRLLDVLEELVRDLNAAKPPPTPAFLGAAFSFGPAGVRVDEVERGSPAAAAGLQRGDVILALDVDLTRSDVELADAIQRAGPGKKVKLTVERARPLDGGSIRLLLEATLGGR